MENTIEEVNKKYERYTFLNQKFNEYMKKSYNIQKNFDLKEKQKLYDELWVEYGELVEEYLVLDKFFTELNKQVNKPNKIINENCRVILWKTKNLRKNTINHNVYMDPIQR